jgi:hypothetical protein
MVDGTFYETPSPFLNRCANEGNVGSIKSKRNGWGNGEPCVRVLTLFHRDSSARVTLCHIRDSFYSMSLSQYEQSSEGAVGDADSHAINANVDDAVVVVDCIVEPSTPVGQRVETPQQRSSKRLQKKRVKRYDDDDTAAPTRRNDTFFGDD